MDTNALAEYSRLIAVYNAAVQGLAEAYATAKEHIAVVDSTKATLDAFATTASLSAVPQPDEVAAIKTDLEKQ